jgi:hypothetical protein
VGLVLGVAVGVGVGMGVGAGVGVGLGVGVGVLKGAPVHCGNLNAPTFVLQLPEAVTE